MHTVAAIVRELVERDLLELAATVSRAHGVRVDDMCTPGQYQALELARASRIARYAFWIELRALRWSYPRIAALFGLDHTSVIYGVRKMTDVRNALEERKTA